MQRRALIGMWIGLFSGGLLLSYTSGAESPNLENGRAIYERHCQSCHGERGRGDGPRAPFLSPRPGNFVSAATSVKSDEELLAVIANGKPRTAMKGWADILSEQDQRDVLAYIRSFIRFQRPSLTPPPPGYQR
ncbi:MAG: cytochrome c [Nitrospirae bacterium]|nr:MAG: cytochrome c [Nitrospirota bacterium]